jgi:hypothetical protein
MFNQAQAAAQRTRVYSLSRCCALVMAASTDCRLTRDLMLDAVPYSFASMACVWATFREQGGEYKDTHKARSATGAVGMGDMASDAASVLLICNRYATCDHQEGQDAKKPCCH